MRRGASIAGKAGAPQGEVSNSSVPPSCMQASLAKLITDRYVREHGVRRAPNTLSTVVAGLNPALSNQTMLGHLIETTFERIFVLCFDETCLPHEHTGAHALWWPSIRDRITVFNGRDLDRKNADLFHFFGCTATRCPQSEARLRLATGGRAEIAKWRKGSRHRVASLLSHLSMVEHAAQLNLTNVLILEADFVRAALSETHLACSGVNSSVSLLAAQKMHDALKTHDWEILRFSMSINPIPTMKTAKNTTVCTRHCLCRDWEGNRHVEAAMSYPKMCVVRASANASFNASFMPPLLHWSQAPMCDLRDSSAYAVHSSAFSAFVTFLRQLRRFPGALRNETADIPHVDIWLPNYFDNLMILPQLVAQQSRFLSGAGMGAQRSGLKYERCCHAGRRASVSAKRCP